MDPPGVGSADGDARGRALRRPPELELYDDHQNCGIQAAAAKYLGAEAGFDACDRAMSTHGGYAYAKEYHVERLWREARLLRNAPFAQEMVLNYISTQALKLPRAY